MAAPPNQPSKPFEDFDDPDVFNKFKDLATSHETRNFVIEFNERKASCAFDLDKHDFEAALKGRNHEVSRTWRLGSQILT